MNIFLTFGIGNNSCDGQKGPNIEEKFSELDIIKIK